MASRETTGLFNLPAELRNAIYTLVFSSSEPTRIIDRERYRAPGLLLVNKQIQEEATPLFYSTTTFVTMSPGHRHWLQHAPNEYISKIRCIYYDWSMISSAQVQREFDWFRNLVQQRNIKVQSGVLWLPLLDFGPRVVWINELGEEREYENGAWY